MLTFQTHGAGLEKRGGGLILYWMQLKAVNDILACNFFKQEK